MADDSDKLRNLYDTLPYARRYLQETVLQEVSTVTSHLHLLRSWQYKLKGSTENMGKGTLLPLCRPPKKFCRELQSTRRRTQHRVCRSSSL